MATPKSISLKLLVNKNSGNVLFAEAGKEFVDFLFGLLAMPIGCIVSLLTERGAAGPGSLGSVSQSVKSLDCSYLLAGQRTKDSLLNPAPAYSNATGNFLLPSLGSAYCSPGEGYVKGVVSYMVMDDLEVKPMSTISSITLLNTFDVKDVGCLEEKTVEIDVVKGLELVRASFNSATVLTDVSLSNDVISAMP